VNTLLRGESASTDALPVNMGTAEELALLSALCRALPSAVALDTKLGRSCWVDDLGDLIGKLAAQMAGANCGGRE
jgi:hypothetical protein